LQQKERKSPEKTEDMKTLFSKKQSMERRYKKLKKYGNKLAKTFLQIIMK